MADNVEIDALVTKDLFKRWRSPRFGSSNPEKMNNPVWDWIIRSGLNAYQVNQKMGGPSSMKAGPCCCFDRLGQTSTILPDGRVIMIAGEHEDYYDPDFNIYNDVVVKHPDGRVDIYGYPKDVFMPTDFHSATLCGDRIIIVGCLGYQTERRYGETPVMVLDIGNMSMVSVPTSGENPGWIHRHEAVMSDDGRFIIVTHGNVDRGEGVSIVENIDDWRLDLGLWRWERLVARNWRRWEISRADGNRLHMFEYSQALWRKQIPELGKALENLDGFTGKLKIPSLKEEIGVEPDLDLYERLYQLPLSFEPIKGSEEEYNIRRNKVDGVIVRYVEDMASIHVTVEGELPEGKLKTIVQDLCEKLSRLENAACEANTI